MGAIKTRIKSTAVQTPTGDGKNAYTILRQLKEIVEIGQRLRGDPGDSFVRVSELVSAGIIRIENGIVQPPNTNAPPGDAVPGTRQVKTVASLTGGGALTTDLTLSLLNDVTSPGNSFYYGTNSSGVKAWLAFPAIPTVSALRGATWVNGAGAVTTPAVDVPVLIPFTGTIREVVILTRGGPGACEIDVWKKAVTSYPPTVADSITATNYPVIAAGNSFRDTTLSGWTTAVTLDDVLMFHLRSSSTFTEVSIQLRIS